MANIRQFENPIDKINPSSAGSEAFEIEGRHIGADIDFAGQRIGQAIGTVTKEVGEEHDAAAAAQIAKFYSGFDVNENNNLNSFLSKSDPADPSLADKYAAQLNDRLSQAAEQWSDMSRTSQRFAQLHENQIRNSYLKQFHADVANMAGNAAGQGLKQTGDTYSAGLLNNPASLDSNLDSFWGTYHHMVDENPNLTADQKQKALSDGQTIASKMAQSAAIGRLLINPQQLSDEIDKGQWGKYGLTGEQLGELKDKAQTRIRQIDEAKRIQTDFDQAQARKTWDAGAAELDGQLPDLLRKPGGAEQVEKRLTVMSLLDGANVGTIDAIRAQMHEITHPTRQPVISDPDAYNALEAKALTGELTFHDVGSARQAHSISNADGTFLLQESKAVSADAQHKMVYSNLAKLTAQVAKEFPSVNPLTGRPNEGWLQRQQAALGEIRQTVQDAINSGADPQTLTDMFNGNSPNFVGKLADKYMDPRATPNFLTTNSNPMITLRPGHEEEDYNKLKEGQPFMVGGKMVIKGAAKKKAGQ